MDAFVTLPFDKYGETEQKSILEATLAIIFFILKRRGMQIYENFYRVLIITEESREA